MVIFSYIHQVAEIVSFRLFFYLGSEKGAV